MAKVLLVNPAIRIADKPRHVPFGLAQLAAVVGRAGHLVQVLDCNAWRPSEAQLDDVLRADDWQVIAIGGLVTSYGYIKEFVRRARRVSPGSRIVVGGGVVTPIPRQVLGFLPEVDFAVIGEGYATFPELLEAIDDGTTDFGDIPGIAWRTPRAGIALNENRRLLEDVDALPFPAWEMFPLEVYFANSGLLLSEEAMLSERRLEFCCSYGCPYHCKYCFHLGLSGELDIVGSGPQRDVAISAKRKVRWHSPAYVVELAGYCRERFGADFISFLDENFVALDRFTRGKWIDEFEALWHRAGLTPRCIRKGQPHDGDCRGVHWGTTCHPNLAGVDLLKRLRALGCSHLDFGFESFSDAVLKAAGKGATKKSNLDALAAARKAGIRAIPNQIIGFPNESFESILESLDVWCKTGIRARPFLATPYPGSEWYYDHFDAILAQYDGDLEAFLLDLGDATNVSAVISENFDAVELLGLRELMVTGDRRRIERYRERRHRIDRALARDRAEGPDGKGGG